MFGTLKKQQTKTKTSSNVRQVCERQILFGMFSRAPANFITAQRMDLKNVLGGGEGFWGWLRRESEEGGSGDVETSPPIYLTATTPTARCPLLSGTVPPPPSTLISAPKLPGRHSVSALGIGSTNQSHPHKPPSTCRTVEGNRFGKPEPWLCCWTALRSRQPSSACSAAGSRGGGRNARSAKVHLLLCSVRGVIGGAADRGGELFCLIIVSWISVVCLVIDFRYF